MDREGITPLYKVDLMALPNPSFARNNMNAHAQATAFWKSPKVTSQEFFDLLQHAGEDLGRLNARPCPRTTLNKSPPARRSGTAPRTAASRRIDHPLPVPWIVGLLNLEDEDMDEYVPVKSVVLYAQGFVDAFMRSVRSCALAADSRREASVRALRTNAKHGLSSERIKLRNTKHPQHDE